MPKRTKKTLPTCEQHLFILKAKHTLCRFGQTATVSFCDAASDKNKNKNKKCRNCQALDCPIFNNDKNFATPTFILCSQKQYYDERGIKMREQHQKKMVEYTDEKDSLNIPKPRTRNNFCSVCRQVYEDYLDHIESEKHKKKVNSSVFNKYILDAAQKFNPNPQSNYPFNCPTLSTGDQDDVEVIENRPMKKVKSDYESHQRFQYGHEHMKPQIALPPHLNLSNQAYFPTIEQQMNYLPNQMHQFSIPPMNHQMALNYNMNMFMNSFYSHHQYGMMNPWMDCYQMHQMNHSLYPKIDQNYFMAANMQQKLPRQPYEQNVFQLESQQKQEVIKRQQKVIIIDDDGPEEEEKPKIHF